MESRQEPALTAKLVDTPDQPSLYIEIDDVSDDMQCQEEVKGEEAAEVDDFSSLPT
jgi:hypothetical protein